MYRYTFRIAENQECLEAGKEMEARGEIPEYILYLSLTFEAKSLKSNFQVAPVYFGWDKEIAYFKQCVHKKQEFVIGIK